MTKRNAVFEVCFIYLFIFTYFFYLFIVNVVLLHVMTCDTDSADPIHYLRVPNCAVY